MDLAPTTELEAVNEMLKAVGETPINSLDSLGFSDAAIARDTLRVKARETLSRGWYFNRDAGYVFTPATDGTVVLPPNVLSIRPSSSDDRRIIPRNGKLWNADDQTYVFPADSGPVMDVIWWWDFPNLPESARRYITVRAATKFQADFMGNDQSYKYTSDDEQFALSVLIEEERLYEERGNMFNDSTDVSEIWQR